MKTSRQIIREFFDDNAHHIVTMDMLTQAGFVARAEARGCHATMIEASSWDDFRFFFVEWLRSTDARMAALSAGKAADLVGEFMGAAPALLQK